MVTAEISAPFFGLKTACFCHFLAKLAKSKLSQQNILSIIFSKICLETSSTSRESVDKIKKNIMESFLQNLNFGKKVRKTAIFRLKVEIRGSLQMAGEVISADRPIQ